MEAENIIRETVLDFPEDVLNKFKGKFSEDIDEFIIVLDEVFSEWRVFDDDASDSESLAHISSLIYGAINLKAISMHLLISGLIVPAGNIQRQVLESIAMAFLASKINLGYLHKYTNNRFSTHKAVDLVIKKHKILNLDRDALKMLKRARDFYNQYSHPTTMTMATNISFESRGDLYFGASFDAGKIEMYRKEVSLRVDLAKTLFSFINGIKYNLKI